MGHNEELGKPARPVPANWRLLALSWSEFARDFPDTPLSREIRDLLEQLQIPGFILNRSEYTMITANLFEAARAFEVIEDTCKRFDFKPKFRRPSIKQVGDEWYFGMNLRRVKDKNDRQNNILLLAALADTTSDNVAWFGYEGGENADVTVWVHCGNPDAAAMVRKLVSTRDAGRYLAPAIPDSNDVWFEKSDSQLPDRAWFEMIFQDLGLHLGR